MVGSSGHKGISRIDSSKNNTHGWYVRVQYRGETHAKFFSDSSHGGQQKALAKAVRHRNQIEKELGKPRTDRTVTVGTVRNNSGVQGIKRILKGSGFAYEVTWSPSPGVIQRTTVSIKKYGENEAFRRAVRIRQAKEKMYFGGLITRDWPDTPPPELLAGPIAKPAAKATTVPKTATAKATKAPATNAAPAAKAPSGKAPVAKAPAKAPAAATAKPTKTAAAKAPVAKAPAKTKATQAEPVAAPAEKAKATEKPQPAKAKGAKEEKSKKLTKASTTPEAKKPDKSKASVKAKDTKKSVKGKKTKA
jgi:chemotaxis protein histidine kinase CheA